MKNTEEIWSLVDAKERPFTQLSDRVWEMPELCYGEFRSCAEHTATLERQGFRVTKDVAGIPTAVVGEAGDGGPVIAILGEYDALPGLSQEAGIAEPRALPGSGDGHGCGHNLLGSASLLAATAVKDFLARHAASRAACVITAARRRKAAPPRGSWCGPECFLTWMSRSLGTPPPSPASMNRHRSPTPASTSPSPAAPRTPPPHRIWDAARLMRWS